MDEKIQYKLAFLNNCVDARLSIPEMVQLANVTADRLEKQASLPAWGLAAAAFGPAVAGVAAGKAVAEMQDMMPERRLRDTVQRNELLAAYTQATRELQQQSRIRKKRQQEVKGRRL